MPYDPITGKLISTTSGESLAGNVTGATSTPTLPTTTIPQTGSMSTFSGLMQNLKEKLQYNNELTQQRQYLVKHLYDTELSDDEISSLPEDVQKVVRSGNKSAIELQLRTLNDEVQGRGQTLDTSIKYLTDAYQKDLEAAETRKKDALTALKDYASASGDTEAFRQGFVGLYGDYLTSMGIDADSFLNETIGTTGAVDTTSLREIFGQQESGGDYSAVNKDSGALGKYQFMPSTLAGMGITDTEAFLNDPELQDQTFDTFINDLKTQYGGNMEKVIAHYYGGTKAAQVVGTSAGDVKQGKYPSINEYVNSILGKVQPTTGAINTDSKSILAQTGLSYNAFMVLTGKMSQLSRDKATRAQASKEAAEFANAKGVDVSTMSSQYQALNDVLESNIKRYNSSKIMENELIGTVDNLQGVVNEKDLGNLRMANVIKVWAGQETNDTLAQQYAMHLYQLREELAAYAGALQGRTGNNITDSDRTAADLIIKNGVSSGSLQGLKKAVESSTSKMGAVLQTSVDSARQQVWDLFGVGSKYKKETTSSKSRTTSGTTSSGIKYTIE